MGKISNRNVVYNMNNTVKKKRKAGLDTKRSNLNSQVLQKSLMVCKSVKPNVHKFSNRNKVLLDFDSTDQKNLSKENKQYRDEHVTQISSKIASKKSNYEITEEVENYDSKIPITITPEVLRLWENELQDVKSVKTIKKLTDAFHAAILSVSHPNQNTDGQFIVKGNAAFNAVIQACILYLPKALKKFLKSDSDSKSMVKSRWLIRVKTIFKSYLRDLLHVLQYLTSSEILCTLLKHLYDLISFTQLFSSLNKLLIRILLKLWSTEEENVCVIAFLNIYQLANSDKSVLQILLKTMYVKYIENSKFVTPNTLHTINFMRCSLVEIYLLDPHLTYNYVFLYLRQLAISLRNAMTLKTKENFQAVYNWQFINSLRFWGDFIIASKSQTILLSFLYPLVQIITGTIKLIPTAQFYPLRFYCIQILISISKQTGSFISILPFLFEVLNSYDFNDKHKAVSMKPIKFTCLLRVSKSQLKENSFKDAIIENIYRLTLETAAKDSHMCYFPDVYIPLIIQIKAFLKKCKVLNFCKKMKQLLNKIQENCQFIEAERKKIAFDIRDMIAIRNWENGIKNQGTPLAKFYHSWLQFNQAKNSEDFSAPVFQKSCRKRHGDNDHYSDINPIAEGSKKKIIVQNKRKKKVIHENKTCNGFAMNNDDFNIIN